MTSRLWLNLPLLALCESEIQAQNASGCLELGCCWHIAAHWLLTGACSVFTLEHLWIPEDSKV